MLRHSTRHLERAEQVDLHLVVELLIGDILSGSNSTRSGIVDEDIDASEVLHRLAYHIVAHLSICHIAAYRQHLYAIRFAQFGCHFFQFLHTACNRNDVATLIGQSLRHLHSQSA